MITCDTCFQNISDSDLYIYKNGKYYHPQCVPSPVIAILVDIYNNGLPKNTLEKKYLCDKCNDTGMIETSYYDGVERNYDHSPCRDCNKGFIKTAEKSLNVMKQYMNTISAHLDSLHKEIKRVEKRENK